MGRISEEAKMQNRILLFVTSALILAYGATAASAQQGPMMQPQAQTQQQKQQERPPREAQTARRDANEDPDDDSEITGWHYGPGAGRPYRDWDRRDMRFGMMGRGGMMGPWSMHSGMMMRMLFAMMDGDGDGTVSLQEFQAAHERIFRAMDANKDGVLTMEEIMAFMQGTRAPAPRQ
jgi:hypothetical protein